MSTYNKYILYYIMRTIYYYVNMWCTAWFTKRAHGSYLFFYCNNAILYKIWFLEFLNKQQKWIILIPYRNIRKTNSTKENKHILLSASVSTQQSIILFIQFVETLLIHNNNDIIKKNNNFFYKMFNIY